MTSVVHDTAPARVWVWALHQRLTPCKPGFTCRKQVVVGGGGTRAHVCLCVCALLCIGFHNDHDDMRGNDGRVEVASKG